MNFQDKILLIYTGGTIGMQKKINTNVLIPFDFDKIKEQIPELKLIPKQIDTFSFDTPIDSSNARPEHWKKIARVIEYNYDSYDGFVILHGTDTMAYTASALSFMLNNLSKPVILTGSQLPIGDLRTDAKENIITSIEIAGSHKNNKPLVPEVAIYFEFKLLRGNRTTKYSTDDFNAFDSPNYNPLAKSGVYLKFFEHRILPLPLGNFSVQYNLNTNVLVYKVTPVISKEQFKHIINTPNLKALILETYGAGNALTEKWFLECIKQALNKNNIIIINTSQCLKGSLLPYKYETGKRMMELGVYNAKDMTLESTLTKIIYLLGNNTSIKNIKKAFETSLKGEISADY